MGKRRLIDLADIPPTHRLCVLPWRMFGAFSEDRKATIVAVGAALAALQGLDGKCNTTATAVGRVVGKNERQVRDAFWALSRLHLWTRGARVNRTQEWWVNVGQMALFSDSQPATGAARDLAQPATGAGRESGTNGVLTDTFNDDGARETAEPVVELVRELSSSSSLLKTKGMTDDQLAIVATWGRTDAQIAEQVAALPYRRPRE